MTTFIPIMDLGDIAYPGDPELVLHGDGTWGPAGAGQGVVLHGTDATVERPDVDFPVIWVGTVTPTKAINGDIQTKPSA